MPSKTFYPDEETARWIEQTAEKNDRSESYVTAQVLAIARRETEPPEDFDDFKEKLTVAIRNSNNSQ